MRWLAMLCVVLVLCTCPARAVSPEEVLESQEDALGIEEVEREAQRQGGSAVYGESLDQGLEGLIETGKGEMFGIVRTGVRSAVILFLILLLCGVEIGTATGVVIFSWIIIPGGISFLFYRRKFP